MKAKRVAMTVGAVTMAAGLFGASAGLAGPATTQAAAKTTSKVAIVYFSGTGTTKSVATKIQKKTKGTLVRVQASDPYTSADLDWTDEKSRVWIEHNSNTGSTPATSSVRPKIKNLKAIKKAVKKAKTVYLGYPIWWAEAPHIMYTLVENVSLKSKNVAPFTTSMSSGSGSSATHLKARAKVNSKTKWAAARSFYGRSSQKTVNKWVNGIKF